MVTFLKTLLLLKSLLSDWKFQSHYNESSEYVLNIYIQFIYISHHIYDSYYMTNNNLDTPFSVTLSLDGSSIDGRSSWSQFFWTVHSLIFYHTHTHTHIEYRKLHNNTLNGISIHCVRTIGKKKRRIEHTSIAVQERTWVHCVFTSSLLSCCW